MSPVQVTAVLNSFPGIKKCSLLNVAVLSAKPSGFADKSFLFITTLIHFFYYFAVLLTPLLFQAYHIIEGKVCLLLLFPVSGI